MRHYLFLVPVEKHGINAELRQKGKIAMLACGYNGSVGAVNTNATTTARIRRAKEATRANCQVRLCEKTARWDCAGKCRTASVAGRLETSPVGGASKDFSHDSS